MFITIPFEELEKNVLDLFSSSEELSVISQVIFDLCIDYADSTIYGKNKITREEYALFHFSRYDMHLSNRFVDYKIEFIDTGIQIEIWNTRDTKKKTLSLLKNTSTEFIDEGDML